MEKETFLISSNNELSHNLFSSKDVSKCSFDLSPMYPDELTAPQLTGYLIVYSQNINFLKYYEILEVFKQFRACQKYCSKMLAYYTGLFKMIVGVLTTCHTQYTWDRSIYIFLYNRTTLQVFVAYLTSALCMQPLWFYKHQHENRVRSKLFVACQLFAVRRHLSKLHSKRRNA